MSSQEPNKKREMNIYVKYFLLAIPPITSIILLVWIINDFQIKNRPYLHIIPEAKFYNYTNPKDPAARNSKASLDLVFKNVGNVPASDIRVEYDIKYDDRRPPNPDEFFKTAFGKAPRFTTIFPGETLRLPLYNPDIGPSTKIFTFNVKVFYTGMLKNWGFFGLKKYWYDYKSEYMIVYDEKKEKTPIRGWIKSYVYTDWDRIS